MTIASQSVSAPDWSTIVDTIRCPLCEYDLRGLSEPRCPECGYQFQWPELLEADRRDKLFVFEHAISHYRRAFLRTSIAGWAPWRFWRRLQPQQPIDLGRLRLYSLVSLLLFFVAEAAYVFVVTFFLAYDEQRDVPSALFEFTNLLRRMGPRIPLTIALCGVMYLAWPWLSYLALLIFTDSMRRANVARAHVLRCTLYSCDAGFVFGIVASVLAYSQPLDPRWLAFETGLLFTPAQLCLVGSAALFGALTTIRLAFAYRLYLRFPHATTTAIASQVIMFLVAAFISLTLAS